MSLICLILYAKNMAPKFALRLYMSVISIVTKSLIIPTLFKKGGGRLLMKDSLYKTYPT